MNASRDLERPCPPCAVRRFRARMPPTQLGAGAPRARRGASSLVWGRTTPRSAGAPPRFQLAAPNMRLHNRRGHRSDGLRPTSLLPSRVSRETLAGRKLIRMKVPPLQLRQLILVVVISVIGSACGSTVEVSTSQGTAGAAPKKPAQWCNDQGGMIEQLPCSSEEQTCFSSEQCASGDSFRDVCSCPDSEELGPGCWFAEEGRCSTKAEVCELTGGTWMEDDGCAGQADRCEKGPGCYDVAGPGCLCPEGMCWRRFAACEPETGGGG